MFTRAIVVGGLLAGTLLSGTTNAFEEPAPAPAGEAKITGKVTFKGTAPQREPLQMKEDCAALHTEEPLKEEVVVNDNKTLRNVFVYINPKSKGLEGKKFEAPKSEVVIDQKGCAYSPHVLGLQVGQPLKIKNSDSVAHNIKGSPKNNPKFNYNQPNPMDQTHTFKMAESSMVTVECNVHGWMKAYVGVLPHPFFGTTGADGSFEINNLPAGEYDVIAWHEKFGTKNQTITVGDKETKTVEFSFEEK